MFKKKVMKFREAVKWKWKTIEYLKRMGSATFVEVLLAILLPPLGVFLRYGIKVEFWIDLVLTFFAYLPGIVYAVYVLVGKE